MGDRAEKACAMTPLYDLLTLKFTGRVSELTKICMGNFTFVLIDALPGFGKTRLLEAVTERLKDKLKCIVVPLEQCRGKLAIRKAIIDQGNLPQIPNGDSQEADSLLIRHLGLAGNVVLIFDSVEKGAKEDRKWLLERDGFVDDCLKSIPGGFRVIVAGNCAGVRFPFMQNIDSEIIQLTPLSLQEVEEVLTDASEQFPLPQGRDIRKERKTWARNMMRLSGGHPRSVQRLITYLVKKNCWIINFRKEDVSLLSDCIIPEIVLLTRGVEPRLKRTLEILSVFRIFDNYMAQALQQALLSSSVKFPRDINSGDAVSSLYKCGLITKEPNSTFYSGTILRNLILTRLRVRYPGIYRILNLEAQKIYDRLIDELLRQIQQSHGSYTSPDPQTTLEIFVRESVDHSLRYILSNDNFADEVTVCLRKHSNYLVQGIGADKDDPKWETKLKNMILGDRETQNVLEERDLDFQTLCQIAFMERSITHADDTNVEMRATEVKRSLCECLMTTLEALWQPLTNPFITHWKDLNSERDVVSLHFSNLDQMLQKFDGMYPSDRVLKKKLQLYRSDNLNVLVNEVHIKRLKERIEQAQETVDRYKVKLNKPMSETDKTELEAKIDDIQKNSNSAIEELAGIYAYLYS